MRAAIVPLIAGVWTAILGAAMGLAPSPAGATAAPTAPPDEATTPVAVAAEADLEGHVEMNAVGSVQFSVPITEGVVSATVRLPELRCPPHLPLIEDGAFGMSPDPIEVPPGIELGGNARHAVSASWARFVQDASQQTVALEAGSEIRLEGLVIGDGPAIFTLHCTDDVMRSVDVGRLGRLPEVVEVRIGSEVEEHFGLPEGVWIEQVRDLPEGFELSSDGVLSSGQLWPRPASDHVVHAVLTDGRVSSGQSFALRFRGEIVWHITQTWTVTKWTPIDIGRVVCPPEHPWTIAEQFHSLEFLSTQRVPSGVEVISVGWVGVESLAVYQGSLGRGLTDVHARNLQPFEIPSALHLRLHCTNDSNLASRR